MKIIGLSNGNMYRSQCDFTYQLLTSIFMAGCKGWSIQEKLKNTKKKKKRAGAALVGFYNRYSSAAEKGPCWTQPYFDEKADGYFSWKGLWAKVGKWDK